MNQTESHVSIHQNIILGCFCVFVVASLFEWIGTCFGRGVCCSREIQVSGATNITDIYIYTYIYIYIYIYKHIYIYTFIYIPLDNLFLSLSHTNTFMMARSWRRGGHVTPYTLYFVYIYNHFLYLDINVLARHF